MPKKFYTEKDIEDLFRGGTTSLQLTDEVVLTELAYEKARRLGLQLVSDRPDQPPAAPVRPYLSNGPSARPTPIAAPVSQTRLQPAFTSSASREDKGNSSAVEQRIRSAVIAKLGNHVDGRLLDTIIHRVVKSTGLK